MSKKKSPGPATETRPQTSLMLDAFDNIYAARNSDLDAIQEFVGNLIEKDGIKDDGMPFVLAIQLFAENAGKQLVKAEAALNALLKLESTRKAAD